MKPDTLPSAYRPDPAQKPKGRGWFIPSALAIFLIILFRESQLVALSFRSLMTSGALLLIDPSALGSIFTPEITAFWIAAFYLILAPAILGLILWKQRSNKNQQEARPEEESLRNISLRAFMRQKIALYASAIIFVLYSVAFLAPFLAPFSPYDQQDFLVTAYKPPLTELEALVLKQSKTLEIPLQEGSGIAVDLANSLVTDFRALKTRNLPNAIRFVDEYRIENGTVTYRQGMRTKTMPVEELKDPLHPALSRTFVLGTDQYGRDILSRLIYGSRISLSIGFLVVLISVTLGTVVGVTSGYFGGWIDAVSMRIVDVLIAFPALFLILIIIATFGNSIYLIVITLSFTGWMGVARIVRSQVLSLKEQEFILAARSLGLSHLRIIFRHLAPNTLTPVIIAATLRIGSIILTEAGLSFLGLGVQPPVPSWGNIINEGRDSLLNHWWISTFPGIAILITVVCFNLIGDGVRDALDPRMRGQDA
ncbi:ABC transporter permease [Pelodictyon luteolum]|uniref:Peptide ABC transporter, permease protein, putative n=1 Tax=Chlorobium luteolum (strain DSM 273 / BCRC 81028 / 2530) TaxID=319225 RepID=Q3B379_CHLL3|nr:peptide ABC transporter, permease protein, putative [Pelodictyon luteolum DSM 273]